MKGKEDYTELHSGEFVQKDHPQIVFRGWVDTLYAHLLFAGVLAKRECLPARNDLRSLMDYCREISRAEVNEAPLKPLKLMGLEPDEIRRLSHHPQEMGGYHFFPDIEDGQLIAAVNLARAAARSAERAAVTAFAGQRTDIVEALNRISSAAYIIMCRIKFMNYEAGNHIK